MPETADLNSFETCALIDVARVEIISPPRRRTAPRTRQSLDISLFAEADREVWNAYVRNHNEGTLFHTMAWHDAVVRSYAHDARYLIARSNGAIVGVLPAFFIASRILGRIIISVPYGVGGGVLADKPHIADQLLAQLKEIANETHCGFIDFRSEQAIHADLPVQDRYVGFERILPDRAEDVLGWLPRKARAAARNARSKYGLTVDFDPGHVRTVWRLYTQSMRRLGSLNYPYRFFTTLADCLPRNHWVCVVRCHGRPVAGLVTFLYKDRVMPYFYGATEEARRFDAGNLIYLSAMERGVAAGYRTFDFGRSRIDNTGSVNFKRFCGFEPRPLKYQYYCAPGTQPPDTLPTSGRYALARRVWPKLPLFVTRALGAALTRHIPG